MNGGKNFRWGFFIGFLIGVVSTRIVISYLNPQLPPSISNQWGTFPANPRSEWEPNGRDQKLLEDFVYVDPRKKAWVAPRDSIVNGASIPQTFWSIIGGPLEGKYRNASIVHDIECERMTEPWEDVHYMFYEACRCGGLSETKAKAVYLAVYHFGPRWALEKRIETVVAAGPDGEPETRTVERTVAVPILVEQPPAGVTPDNLEEFIRKRNPSLEDLQQLNLNDL